MPAKKPLFIPLKAKFFDAFERGEKDTEYRLRGPRWNAETCRIGRRVVLSRGYGKQRRLTGVIASFHYDTLPARNIPSWTECYDQRAGDAACIRIALDQRTTRGTLELARDATDNLLKNGALCPNDTDGDGDCGRPLCPVCGTNPL